MTVSDRDIIHKGKKLNDLSGHKILENKIIESCSNFDPDIVVLGHADAVNINTLEFLKTKNKDLRFSQWFLDPVSKFGPDFKKNKNRILDKSKIMNGNFLTTDPNSLSFKINKSYFIPNPCDHAFETLNNYENNCDFDVFFAMSHGVHRGGLKSGKVDDREIFINKLIKRTNNIKFDVYGMNKIQPIWGNKFIERISNCSMGLNLSRGKPIRYYSSDRMAQLIGNGLLTFVDHKTFFSDFFSNKEMVFYNNLEDLIYKVEKFKVDYKERKKIAKNGKNSYFKYFNSDIVADFILSKTMDIKAKNKFIWQK
jgi:hypothetical protein